MTKFLLDQFRPDSVPNLSVCVKFVWGEGERNECQVAIEKGMARASDNHIADLTLVFASSSLMEGILRGKKSPFEHFLTGEFRSDGGLPLVFPILQAFAGR